MAFWRGYCGCSRSEDSTAASSPRTDDIYYQPEARARDTSHVLLSRLGLSGYTVGMAVFFYDLLCTSRRGRVVLLRSVYAVALLVALYCLYLNWLPEGGSAARIVPPSVLAKFAEEFVRWFLLI